MIALSSKQLLKQSNGLRATKAKSVTPLEHNEGPEEGSFFRNSEEEPHQRIEKTHEKCDGFFADGSHEGCFKQKSAQTVGHMGAEFMEEDTELSHTSFNSENYYTRNGSRHVEAPHISSPVKSPPLSTNSRRTPHQSQTITSPRSASAAAVPSGELNSSPEDTSAGEEQESKYFSPKKTICIRTGRPNQVCESGSGTSELMDLDAMDVDFDVPRSSRNQSGVSENDQQPQKVNMSPKKKVIPVLQ